MSHPAVLGLTSVALGALALVVVTACAGVDESGRTTAIGEVPARAVGAPPTEAAPVSTVAQPDIADALESGDLCVVNRALQQMVSTSGDGWELAKQMRSAADAAEEAAELVPSAIQSDWSVMVNSLRRYADALDESDGNTEAPAVRAIGDDGAYERASSRVSTWIRQHCGTDG